jgi:O-antigen ligase
MARRGVSAAILAGIAAAGTVTSTIALAAGAPEPVGYANALGLFAAMGTIIAFGLAVHATRRSARALGGAAAVVQLAAVVVSASRGALAALAIGLVVAVALTDHRGRAAVALGSRRATSPVGRRRAAVAATVAAVTVGLLVAAAAPVAGDGVSVTARLRLWTVAAHSAADAPLRGAGAGSFARTWLADRPVARPANNAHNLYLETLAELGLPGLLLLAGALGAPLVAAMRARGHPLIPAAVGAYAAFVAHAAIDVDWETPLLTVSALGSAGSILLMARRGDAARPLPRAGALVVVVAVAAFSLAGLASNAALERGRAALRTGAFAQVRTDARAAQRWAPWSTEPLRLLGEAARARGDGVPARAHFRRGVERDPWSWALWRGLARASRGTAGRRAAARAAALNPFGDVDGGARRGLASDQRR